MTPRAVFVGLPGAGKSSVGRKVAARLGIPFADSDKLIEEDQGTTIPEIFETVGETGFREIETRVIRTALRSFDGILALGGGAVTHPATRKALNGHTVVYIKASHRVLLERVTHSHTVRPLLKDNPSEVLARLRAERDPYYSELATHSVYSGAGPVSSVVEEVLRVLEPTTIDVATNPPYQVVIGDGLLPFVRDVVGNAACVVIAYAPPLATYAGQMFASISDRPVHLYPLPDGEKCKTLDTMRKLWDFAARIGLGRDGLFISLGGGATTDATGFAAATWLRGVPVVHFPTTLLAMVDAAIGGKTGINSPAGKNLIGSFYQPRRVLCDLALLHTVPPRDIAAGLGEVVKCGFIADPTILQDISRDPAYSEKVRARVIEKAVRVKARVVGADEKESGLRETLNYGHTLAHAIETATDYTVRHGEAVAIGCIFACALAVAAGKARPELLEKHRAAFTTVHLPVTAPKLEREQLLAIMRSDKKVRAGKLRFVIVTQPGHTEILTDPRPEWLEAAFTEVGL